MRTLPLTVLVHEGPTARAYLECLRRAGMRPRRLVLMVLSRHPTTGAAVGRWLPRFLRLPWAQAYQGISALHWPRQLGRDHPELVAVMERELAGLHEDAADILRSLLGDFAYPDHAVEFERVLVEGLADPALRECLAAPGPATVLFTGGGLVPADLLSLPGRRFLHVHPGRIPAVRGADGLLWSTLLRGRPGATCFVMAPGIDTGAVVAAEDLPPLAFPLPARRRPDDATLYRALFSFMDPLLRATFLARRVLAPGVDPATLPATEQDADAGTTFHFMHPRLRTVALRRLFPDA